LQGAGFVRYNLYQHLSAFCFAIGGSVMTSILHLSVFISFMLFLPVRFFASPQLEQLISQAYQKKNYGAVVGLYDKYMAVFNQNANYLSLLGESYLHLEKKPDAIKVCMRSMQLEQTRRCSLILGRLRSEDEKFYERTLADFFLEIGDRDQAFLKYYRLHRIDPDDKHYRIGFAKIFAWQGLWDFVQEQIWEIGSAAEVQELLKRLEERGRRLRRYCDFYKDKLGPEHGDNVYEYVFYEQKNLAPFVDFALDYYKTQLEETGFSERMVLRYANLLFLKGKKDELRDYLKEYGSMIGTPQYVLSLNSLVRRMVMPEEEKEPEDDKGEQETDKEVEVVLPKIVMTPQAAPDSRPMDLTPFDFSAIDLATTDDLSPFKSLHTEFLQRMSQNPTDYEKRFIYSQINDKMYTLMTDSPDVVDRPVYQYFNSPEGKIFYEKLQKLEGPILEADKRNSQFFSGEYQRFNDTVGKFKTQMDKKDALKGFYLKWKKLAEHPNLEVKHAWTHYTEETPEGKHLMRRVFELVQQFREISPEQKAIIERSLNR
jgi:tetratricopeptide (TPR) repeat protein